MELDMLKTLQFCFFPAMDDSIQQEGRDGGNMGY